MLIAPLEPDDRYPRGVTVAEQEYYILRSDSGYFLASRICPHQGGVIKHCPQDSCFRCPLHNWEFDPTTGRGLNTARGMTMQPLAVRNGGLWLDRALADELPASPGRTLHPARDTQAIAANIDVRLLAHASLEITADSRRILVDPWLDGPAMLGAWRQYPRADISAKDLAPSVIVITHEHSDHFHIPTLRHFDRQTPVYVPKFGNGRLEYFLHKYGFTHIRSVSFCHECEPLPGVRLTYYRPVSIFNDSIMSLDIDGYKFLNLNDAGLNAKIATAVGPVDVLSCIFSTGASGYPMTWTHLDAEKKREIMERACAGRLDMLSEAMDLYRARYLLPFASYFKLWLPEHREYLATMKTNTLMDVVAHFRSRGRETQVIDILPGESWNSHTGAFRRMWPHREELFQPATIEMSLNEDYAAHGADLTMGEYWGTRDCDMTRTHLVSYFEALNANPDISYCEDVFLRVRCYTDGFDRELFNVGVQILKGQLTVKEGEPDPELPLFYLDIPERILGPILSENLSWDEARVGCHLRWWRNTQAVHSGLLRLLQGPYGQKHAEHERIRSHGAARENTIAGVIEVFGRRAAEILELRGLYCVGCSLSPWESIDAAAEKHGLPRETTDALLAELNALGEGRCDRPDGIF